MKTKKLTFRPATQKEMEVCSGLIGYLKTTFENLVKAFGEPDDFFDDYKSDASWHVTSSDGTMIDIYNYKDGTNYLGEEGLDVTEITNWHLGGEGEIFSEVAKALEKATKGKFSKLGF